VYVYVPRRICAGRPHSRVCMFDIIHVAEVGMGLVTLSECAGCAVLLLLHLDLDGPPGLQRHVHKHVASSLQAPQCQAVAEGLFMFGASLVWRTGLWTLCDCVQLSSSGQLSMLTLR
jgi:hypothetical protein